jgi:molybdopterin molybdotransferase
VPVFGLPGNPVSVFVTFVEFVRPVLDRLLGRPVRDPYAAVARLASPVTLTRSRRTHFVRVRLNGAPGKLTARPLAGQGSHRLHSLAGATGWIRLESRRGPWAAGAMVPVRAGDDSRC